MSSNPWVNSIRTVFLFVMVAIIALIFWYVREIFQPLLIAALIAYVFSPLIKLVIKYTKLSRKASANIVFFVVLAILISLVVTVIPALMKETQDIISDLSKSLDMYQVILSKPTMIAGIPVYLDGFITTIRETLNGTLIPKPDQALQFIKSTSRGFLWFLVIIVSTYHLMTEWDSLREWLINLAPDNFRSDIRQIYNEIRTIWLGYLAGQLRLMLILSIVYTAAWSAIGLPGAILIGILAGFLNLVPEVGPGLTALLAILVAWLEGSNFLPISNGWFALLTGGIYLILNNIKTIYLQPRILGKSVSLHEGVVFVAIIAAIMLQGFLGVLIVVPVLASLLIIGRYIYRKLLGKVSFSE